MLGSQPDLLGACPADESGSDSETGPEERAEGNDLKRGKVPPSYIQFHENLVTTSRDIYRDACVVAQEIRELVTVRVAWGTGDDPTGSIARKDFPLKEIGPINSKLQYLNKQLEQFRQANPHWRELDSDGGLDEHGVFRDKVFKATPAEFTEARTHLGRWAIYQKAQDEATMRNSYGQFKSIPDENLSLKPDDHVMGSEPTLHNVKERVRVIIRLITHGPTHDLEGRNVRPRCSDVKKPRATFTDWRQQFREDFTDSPIKGTSDVAASLAKHQPGPVTLGLTNLQATLNLAPSIENIHFPSDRSNPEGDR